MTATATYIKVIDVDYVERAKRSRPAEPLEAKLLRRRRIEGDHWVWPGHLLNGRYGQVRWGSKLDGRFRTDYVHRIAYRLWVGPIPDGHDVHHTCDMGGPCFNPAHLEAKTVTDHRKHHSPLAEACRRGHRFEEDNTYWNRGKRHCQRCRKDARERWRARSKER